MVNYHPPIFNLAYSIRWILPMTRVCYFRTKIRIYVLSTVAVQLYIVHPPTVSRVLIYTYSLIIVKRNFPALFSFFTKTLVRRVVGRRCTCGDGGLDWTTM